MLSSAHRHASLMVVVLACMAAIAGCGSPASRNSGDRTAHRSPVSIDGVTFVSRPALRETCARVARTVDYAVPCLTMLPRGLKATPGNYGCRLGIIGAGGTGHCGRQWRHWIVGSSEVVGANAGGAQFQHLVVVGAPKIVRNPARAIDGPTMIAGSRVERLGRLHVAAIRGWFYYVPFNSNVGSAFTGHLVMVWNASGHTYAYGFHVVDGMAEARTLDLEVAKHLAIVRP
jgi:hypothetical protein